MVPFSDQIIGWVLVPFSDQRYIDEYMLWFLLATK